MHNRLREREILTRKLEAGVNIHMPAPRRIGKTWTIAHLADDLRKSGWRAIEIDVEGVRTGHEFARALCTRIEAQQPTRDRAGAHLKQRLRNLLGGRWGSDPKEAIGKVDPIEFSEALVESLASHEAKTAIIIDEVAYFFLALAEQDPKEAHAFAYKLRALQQRYRTVRWLLTGSVGLDTVARRHGLEGAFVDFETFVLEPFTPDKARSFLRDPTIQGQFTHAFDADDADLDWMFEQLGWLAPYYLRLIANEVRPSQSRDDGRAVATQQDIDAAIDRLLQPNRRSEFAVWREHVHKNLPAADRGVANSVLEALAETPQGETLDTLLARIRTQDGSVNNRQLADVLGMLQTDGLTMQSNGRHAFRSGLVRRHWHEYGSN